MLKILLNDKENVGKRKEVEVEVIAESSYSLRVKLPDGKIINRKKKRDLVK